MKEIIVYRKTWERENRNQLAPDLEGINESVLLRDGDTGKVVAIQFLLDDESKEVRRELFRHLKFDKVFKEKKINPKAKVQSTMRLSGMAYQSEVFGYTAPVKIRRRYGASAARFTYERPEMTKLLDRMTVVAWEKFQELLPEQAKSHEELVEGLILRDWWIAGAPFTSGIINNTAALPYHRDSRNVQKSWSMMLCLRKDMDGGGLHLPEYDITFGIPDGSMTYFDGQSTWHGVTPLLRKRKGAIRFTMVWYSKIDLQGASSKEEEIAEAKRLATDNEAGEARRR
jgi:hypothetical protein